MNNISAQKIVIFSFAILYSLFALPSAEAQNFAISTQRGLYDMELIAGTSQEDLMVIYNLDPGQPLAVHGQLSLWDVKGDSTEIEYVTSEPGFNAAKWFQLKKTEGTFTPLVQTDFIIGPDSRKELPFRISAPADAVPGSYLVVARFSTVNPPAEGVSFVPELDILFFIKVAPFTLEGGVETGYNADIEVAFAKDEAASMRAGTPVAQAGVLEEAIKTVVAKIKNTGIYYFRADGRVVLKNWLGRVVKEVSLPKRYLLPGRIRTLEIPMETDEAPQGFFSSIGRFFSSNSYLGPYTATVVLNFPQATSQTEAGFTSGSTLEKSFTVWIIPWKFWLPVLLLLSLALWLMKRYKKRIRKAFRVLFSRR